MTKPTKPSYSLTDLFADDIDLARRDHVFEMRDRTELGKPRYIALKDRDEAFVRIVKPLDHDSHASRRGASDRRDRHTVERLVANLTGPKSLLGPSTLHEVDEFSAQLFEEAPNFAPAIQAIRVGAQASIRQGARWLQFKPIIIQSAPGAGKTRLVHRLAAINDLRLIYLDCASMSNLTPILGQDSSWSNSRASEIVEGIAQLGVANVLVVLDELDKLTDYGRNSSPQPSQSLVGLFERRSATTHLDHFTQLTIDMSFINWVILVNDLDRLARPFIDRCTVVRLPPPTTEEIATIAAREIVRRGLEPELVAPLTRAVHRGQITSLRRLHKLLDAAAAASTRPPLN